MANRNSQVLYKLPERIKAVRKSRNMSQTDLGIAMGTDKSAVSRMESGMKLPNLTTLANAADAMDISIASLLTDDGSADLVIPGFNERIIMIPPDKREAFNALIEAAFKMAGV